jgi:hypothetical protein
MMESYGNTPAPGKKGGGSLGQDKQLGSQAFDSRQTISLLPCQACQSSHRLLWCSAQYTIYFNMERMHLTKKQIQPRQIIKPTDLASSVNFRSGIKQHPKIAQHYPPK